jgi:hypothetical protein
MFLRTFRRRRLPTDAMDNQQLLGQSELIVDLVRQAAEERTILSRHVEENGKALVRMRLESMVKNRILRFRRKEGRMT